MHCFQHTYKPAIGMCSYCGRGLCQECVVAVDGKLSCRGSCEYEIARERRFLQKSEKAIDQRSAVLQTSGNVYHQSFAIVGFFGLVSVVLGVVMLSSNQAVLGAVLLGMGIIFIMRGVGLARASKSFKSLAAEDRLESTES